MRITVSRAQQGIVCRGEPNGAVVTVPENAASIVRGIINAALFQRDSIDTLVLDGIDLRRIFPPEPFQSSPLPPLTPLPNSMAGALPAHFQSRGPMFDRGGGSERRALPVTAHPDAVSWASLNPYLRSSPNTRITIRRCIGFGSIDRFVRWLQYILPRVPHGFLEHTPAPPLPSGRQ